MPQRMCARLGHRLSDCVNLATLALRCSGYLAGDLVRLLEGANEIAIDR